MTDTPPPPAGPAEPEDAGRHAHPDDAPAAQQPQAPAAPPWEPPGPIVAPPEPTALAMAMPAGLPSGVSASADDTIRLATIAEPAPSAPDAQLPAVSVPAGPLAQQRSTQEVTCPQCGTVVRIDPRARSSLDFCPNPICDYPLFWVRSAIVVTDEDPQGDSHRRMPGTAGRAAAAYLPCPHCSEPNPLSALTCVRCGGDMHPVAPPPEPEPEPLPPPAPVFTVVEEEEPINWWLIILGGIAITLFVAFLVVIVLSYLI